jgi:glucan 1,3-beta-glucosidase
MSGPGYDPLPLNLDHRDDIPYNAPHSPDMHAQDFQTPEVEHMELPEDDLGAARPRFLGRALNDEGPQPRSSYASSGYSLPADNDNHSSVYGLNPTGQGSHRDTAYHSLQYRDDPHDADFHSPSPSGLYKDNASSPYLSEKRDAYMPPRTRSRRRMWLIGGLVALVVAIVVIVVAIYFTVVKPHNSNDSVTGGASKSGSKGPGTSSGASPTSTANPTTKLAVSGGDGSTVTTEDGTTFTYSNSFGGYWYWDENDPFNNGAQAQSWSPPLNQTFQYGVDKIRGYAFISLRSVVSN